MNYIRLGTLLLVIALPVSAFAQGSGSVGHTRAPIVRGTTDSTAQRPFAVTRSLTGSVVEVKAADHLIVVEDNNGQRHEFRVGDDAKLKADKKTELAGKSNLSLGDFQTGQTVRITYLASGRTATEVRLRRAKK